MKFNSSFMLVVTKADGLIYVCSSVAYSKNILLTAAHCLDGAVKVQVCIEDTILLNNLNTFYEVKNFEIHKKYNSKKSNYIYDIGKIYLRNDLPSEIDLCELSDLTDHTSKLYRVGYGERNGVNTKTIISNIKNFTNYDTYFSAYEEYSFSGDSGGPIFQIRDDKTFLVGIHSTREGYSSLNPKPYSFMNWIKKNC